MGTTHCSSDPAPTPGSQQDRVTHPMQPAQPGHSQTPPFPGRGQGQGLKELRRGSRTAPARGPSTSPRPCAASAPSLATGKLQSAATHCHPLWASPPSCHESLGDSLGPPTLAPDPVQILAGRCWVQASPKPPRRGAKLFAQLCTARWTEPAPGRRCLEKHWLIWVWIHAGRGSGKAGARCSGAGGRGGGMLAGYPASGLSCKQGPSFNGWWKPCWERERHC